MGYATGALMPVPTPFHSRTTQYCRSQFYKDWAGYYAVCSYDTCHQPEYNALRHSVGAIDVSPLFKYEISGRDAAAFLSRLTVRDVRKLRPGRVTYLCWCDDDGKVIDDGTLTCFDEGHYLMTAAEPSLSWFERVARGFEVTIEDRSEQLGTLSIQGPESRALLSQVCDADLDKLRFFRGVECRLGDTTVWLSRTGYTGDLGYEVFCESSDAEAVWDVIFDVGPRYDLLPVGLDAMDVTRIEAGFVMNGVDYFSAHHCLVDSRKNSPSELGLDWTLALDREPFIGRDALRRERKNGARFRYVGLEADWEALEEVYQRYGLPPEVSTSGWRDGRPVYTPGGQFVGQATSGAWSPQLKRNLALAQVERSKVQIGDTVGFEITAEYERHRIPATVVEPPFFAPPRKTETPSVAKKAKAAKKSGEAGAQ